MILFGYTFISFLFVMVAVSNALPASCCPSRNRRRAVILIILLITSKKNNEYDTIYSDYVLKCNFYKKKSWRLYLK